MVLAFADLDWYSQPPPKPNGIGLYTGQPAMPGSDWGQVFVPTDLESLLTQNVQPEFLYKLPGSFRPGNNNAILHSSKPIDPNAYNITATVVSK